MVARGRSAAANAHIDHSYDSSPDPLALSANENKAKAWRKTPQKQPFAATSPGKQNRRLSFSDAEFSSPSKSMLMSTPRTANASPWRIRVTVQAEPGSDEENAMSPTVKRITKTKTTTVPLKDPDAQSPVKRPRGRPRKSDTGAATKPRRNGTPAKKARSKSRDASFAALESSAGDVDTDVPPKKRRGRPRKSIQPPVEHDKTVEIEGPDSTSTPATQSQASSPKKIEVPVVDTPSRTELGDQLRTRKGTPHASKAVSVDTLSGEESGEASGIPTPISSEDDQERHSPAEIPSIQVVNVESNTGNLDIPAFEDDDDFESPEFANFAFEEGATRMPDDSTVLDSENFSMISVDSLPGNSALISPSKLGAVQSTEQSSLAAPQEASGSMAIASSNLSPRHITPVVDAEVPSVPPSIKSSQNIAPEAETPRLGRVVTAGVALQGVLDPARLTPQPSQKGPTEKHDDLDDLFRGFSEGTRKELQSNLRFGEQLAREESTERSTFTKSSPSKEFPKNDKKEGIFRTQRKYRQSRLLTPEEQDDYVTLPPQAPESNEVRYPALDTTEMEKSLLSPANSENEMSWRVDTPPVAAAVQRMAVSPAPEIPATARVNREEPQEDYSDIWQEEASRSSNSPEPRNLTTEESSELQELLVGDGPVKPARGKLPRTWRRKSANHFQYSDETGTTEKPSIENADVSAPLLEVQGNGSLEDQESPDEEAQSEDSDDTGMFFQSNIPNVFKRNRTASSHQNKVDKQSLSSLLQDGESILPESSPTTASDKSKSATQINPFLGTPPHFSGFPSSPKKGSPLRKELHSVGISSDSPRRLEDESTLPLAQSSPFHTFVDGQSYLSTASDQRQFRVEMEGSTASTIRRVRSEANRYLDAYEAQERSLNEIEEVTEPSQTWNRDPSFMASSPPRRKQSFAQSMLSPIRRPVPLFSNHEEETYTEEVEETSTNDETEAEPASAEIPQPGQTSLFSRVSSTLLGAFKRPAPPPPHPILSKFPPLPKVKPWTKTHYEALDKLYKSHLKHPTAFAPSMSTATPLSETNTALLNDFLSSTKNSYVGAMYSAWGYSMLMTEELVILCAVYMQLLTFGSIDEYENTTGRQIQMGDCGPGKAGNVIKGDDVVRRLATVVMGEAVRRDEKLGKSIDKSEALTVEWPH